MLRRLDNVDAGVKEFFAPAAQLVLESDDPHNAMCAALAALCSAVGIPFEPAMLSWPSGRRATDGVWAPVWYQTVEQSTGFAPLRREIAFDDLPDALKPVAEAARPIYDRLAAHRLLAAGG